MDATSTILNNLGCKFEIESRLPFILEILVVLKYEGALEF